LSEKEFYFYCEEGFRLTNLLGAHLWGFNWNAQPLHLDANKIFRTNRFFYNILGIRKTELRNDEKLKRIDDVDFWLQHIFRDKGTLRFEQIHADFKMGRLGDNQIGGIGKIKESKKDVKYILNKWPRSCVGLGKDGQIWPVKSPFPGL
jgi:hypothetical protein